MVEANLLAAASADGVGPAFNIAGGEQVTLNRLLAELCEQLGIQIAAEYAPGQVDFAGGIARTLTPGPPRC